MSRIVIIHGMNQQYQSELALLDRARLALLSGCAAARRAGAAGDLPEPDQIALAFYGDLFRSPARPRSGAQATFSLLSRNAAPASEEDAQLSPAEEEALVEICEPSPEGTSAPTADASEPSDEDPNTRAARRTNARAVVMLGRLLDGLGDGATAQYVARNHIKHLYSYLTDADKAAEVKARVDEVITDQTALVIGHSMGSLAAYEVLAGLPEARSITLMTLGSPFGAPYVYRSKRFGDRKQLQRKPAAIKRWFNVVDPRDPVSAIHDLTRMFSDPTDVPATPIYVNNGGSSHDLDRYLNAADTGAAVLHALNA